MIKVVYCNENGKVEISKDEFERLLEDTYLRGVRENSEPSYNRGYRDGYRDGCSRTVYEGVAATTTEAITEVLEVVSPDAVNCDNFVDGVDGVVEEITHMDIENATSDRGLFGVTYTNNPGDYT